MGKRKNKEVVELTADTLDTYFKKRMFEIGITNTAEHAFRVEVDAPGRPYNQPIFAEDKNGNIEIHYPSLYGGPEYIKDSETEFMRVRLHPENQKTDYKYFQEKNSGIHIFIPPGIADKFKAKTKIKTLFVIEGEFKCFAGYLAGLDIIGIGGKDLFTDGDKQSKDLHSDIQAIIRACEVENLVLVLDADIFLLEWDPEEDPHKDLAKRQYGFFNTVSRFRELTKGKVKDVYFSHINQDYLDDAKGLDDLLYYVKDDKKAVVEDLLRLRTARRFFTSMNISGDSLNKLKDYFKLTFIKNLPAAFYAYHKDVIQDYEFNFLGSRFQFTKDQGLQLVKHPDSFKFLRVGTKYYKKIHVPNQHRELEARLTEWSKPEIKMDYVDKGYPHFFDTIDKYDAFCNVPDNTDKYQAVIEGCYNLYFPLEHKPTPGPWPTIEKYLKHAFGEKPIGDGSTTSYDLILDCIQLKYLNPTQKLPIVCLVARERNTGKSTFLWLLQDIFKENTTVIGNQEINDQFNDDWVTRGVIGIDEGFIDKKVVLEKIKSQSTNEKVKLRGMYAGRQDVGFFGWFVLTSNDEDNFITIDKEEIRFWVVKVPILTDEDPHLRKKMKAEIPHFLDFLQNRQLVHPEKGRFWFQKELLDTDALRKIKEKSKGWFAGELKEILTDQFFHFKYHTLYYTLKEIFGMVNNPNSPVRFREHAIREDLENKFGLKARLGRYQHPVDPDTRFQSQVTAEKHGRCYEFRIENFLTEQEIREELSAYMDYDEIVAIRRNSKAFVAGGPEVQPSPETSSPIGPVQQPQSNQLSIDTAPDPDKDGLAY